MRGYVNSYRLLQTTLKATAEQHGQIVDYTKLGQRMLISSVAAKQRVKRLEAEDLVLLLPALGKIAGKKRVRRPRLYLRNKKMQGSHIEEIIKQESFDIRQAVSSTIQNTPVLPSISLSKEQNTALVFNSTYPILTI